MFTWNLKTHRLHVLFSGLLVLGLFSARHVAFAQDKPTIAVADFEVKAYGAHHALGNGMSAMLVNALVETNRFVVVERSRLDHLQREQGPRDRRVERCRHSRRHGASQQVAPRDAICANAL